MKRFSTITLFALLLVVSAIFSVTSTATPPSCGSVCVQSLNACKTACAGNQACIAQCQAEYECCQIQCHGGSCKQSVTAPGVTAAVSTPCARSSTAMFATFSPALLSSATKRDCLDWEYMCHAVEFDYKQGCQELGETDCRCKAHRMYTKCMEEGGCQGYSDAFMLEIGCRPRD